MKRRIYQQNQNKTDREAPDQFYAKYIDVKCFASNPQHIINAFIGKADGLRRGNQQRYSPQHIFHPQS